MATRKTATRKTVRASSEAKRGSGKQRAIQREADAANARREEKQTTAKRASKSAGNGAAKKKAVQGRPAPAAGNPLPRQHQAKPGPRIQDSIRNRVSSRRTMSAAASSKAWSHW
jgi:hypothetical protein